MRKEPVVTGQVFAAMQDEAKEYTSPGLAKELSISDAAARAALLSLFRGGVVIRRSVKRPGTSAIFLYKTKQPQLIKGTT